MTAIPASGATLQRATMRETLGFIGNVLAPTLAKGVIIRRPRMVALAERFDLDRRAVRFMQRLRDRYPNGPVMLRTSRWLPRAVALAPEDVHRILDATPDPFAVVTTEKRAALSHFEPQGVILSRGTERAERRAYNEQVLDAHRSTHRLGDQFVPIVREEAAVLLDEARLRGVLRWDEFTDVWFRIVRRVVFGDIARDDRALSDEIAQLRAAANWAFLRPKRRLLQRRFDAHIKSYLSQAAPGSLAGIMATMPTTPRTMPHQQVPQWLFAADAAGIATFCALAVLVTHQRHAERARAEIHQGGSRDYPYLRACVLDTLRLWPTTPVVLRQTTERTQWGDAMMPAQTGIIIFAPFFHRDDQRLGYANRFSPDLWLEERGDTWPLIPFSDGPAACPGRNLVLLLTSNLLATLLDQGTLTLEPPIRLDPRRPLPGTLDHFTLRFRLGEQENAQGGVMRRT